MSARHPRHRRAADTEAGRPAGAVRVAEADPRRLGVHAAISVPGMADEVLPEYVPRRVDHAEHGVRARVAAPAPAPAATTITFTGVNISDRTFNLGSGHGFAVGYTELVADKLMHGGKQIGHDGQSYTVTRLGVGSANELVSAVEVLAHG
jgi:hypothetical protein